MTKRFQKSVCFLFTTILAACAVHVGFSGEPQQKSFYYQQVPHVVLPQTIQYRPQAMTALGEIGRGGYRNNHPATYTAYPSYQAEQPLEFRTIEQVSYPVTPTSPTWTTPEQAAEYWNNNQVDVVQPNWVKNAELAPANAPQNQQQMLKPTLSPQTPQSNMEIPQLTEQSSVASDKKWTKPDNSLVFVKSQPIEKDAAPAPLLRKETMVATAGGNENLFDGSLVWESNWWRNAEDFTFARQVGYDQPAPPTTFSGFSTGSALQMAPVNPSYSGCFGNSGAGCFGGNSGCHYIYAQQPYCGNTSYCVKQTTNNYESAQTIRDAWNAYYSAYSARQNAFSPIMQVSSPYPGQMGGPCGMNYGQPGMNPMGMAPQGMMPQSPQTLGYIVLYPNPQQSAKNENGTEGTSNPNDPASANSQNMQAMFVPFDSPQGMNIQANMQQNMGMMNSGMNPMMGAPMVPPYMMNPMMGGMNPYMNPMMGGMNPYMMNPMMMGMMNPWMMGPPQIVIQMPQDQGRQRMGFLARRRAAKMGGENQMATASFATGAGYGMNPGMNGGMNGYMNPGMNACCGDPMAAYRTPAKAAYPYGYFGASTEPFQTGCFSNYNNSMCSRVTYPGF